MSLVSFRAKSSITAGDLVRVDSVGFLTKASAVALDSSICVGVALNSAAPLDLVLVNKDSIYTQFSGLTPGTRTYLSLTSGQLYADYAAFYTALSGTTLSGAYLTELGPAISTSGVHIEIQQPVFINK